MNITESSGTETKVGGANFPSVATIHETLFMHRPDYQPDAIIRYSVADIVMPSGERLDNMILLSWEFDDGAVVFGAYEKKARV